MSAYLDLLERALTGVLNRDPPLDPWNGVMRDSATGEIIPEVDDVPRVSISISPGQFDPAIRDNGRDWPLSALTMIGGKRLRQLRDAVREVHIKGIPGDLIECGVWRGGACIMMNGALQWLGAGHRRVFVADSFEGLPPPDGTPQDAGDRHYLVSSLLAVTEEEVRKNFEAYNLDTSNVVFVKGWFKDTLPSLDTKEIAVLRVDGDMYRSTMDVLDALYDKVSKGGFIIIDDYHAVAGCKQAVDEFRAARECNARFEPLLDIDGVGVYWRKVS